MGLSRALLIASLLFIATPAWAEREIAAASLVKPELLAGPGWRVQPRAVLRGYQARFVIETDWGILHADSVELLALRVSEMPALAALNDHQVTAALKDAGGEPFLASYSSVNTIRQRPLATVTGLPRGIARYFGERWQRIAHSSQRLADRSRRVITEDGSPYDDIDSPMAAASASTHHDEATWWSRRGKEVAGLIKSEAGFPAAKRRIAEQLGIDPATGNELIIPRLDGLAWAQASGRFASNEALGLLAGPIGPALAYAVTIDRVVHQDAPEQIAERNSARLAPHCHDPQLLRAFLRQRAFTPSLQTALVDLFLQLAPSSGCEALLETALMADDEAQARFVVTDLRLLAHYLGPESIGGKIVPQGAMIAFETKTGEFLLPLAVDYMTWTAPLRPWFDLPNISRNRYRTLLVSGALSPQSQRELTQRGWSIVSRLPYPGAPLYRH